MNQPREYQGGASSVPYDANRARVGEPCCRQGVRHAFADATPEVGAREGPGERGGVVTRRDGWLGCTLLTVALPLHAAVPACLPRYEYLTFGPENADVLKIDRWTGEQHRFVVGRADGFLNPSPIR